VNVGRACHRSVSSQRERGDDECTAHQFFHDTLLLLKITAKEG
jgi:hypothetical protein